MQGSTAERAAAGAVERAAAVAGAEVATESGEPWWHFLPPRLRDRDRVLDVRLVRPLAPTVSARVRHRNRALALLLSELGASLAGPTQAPAGTKRLATLVHRRRWQAQGSDASLLARGQALGAAEAARVPAGRAVCIRDGSVVEQPERTRAAGLVPVRSSKARRLSRPRPQLGTGDGRGKPGGPIVVAGWQWTAALVTGWRALAERRPLTLGAWHW